MHDLPESALVLSELGYVSNSMLLHKPFRIVIPGVGLYYAYATFIFQPCLG